MNGLVKIYALVDPRNENIFYVGATSRFLENRLYDHCMEKEFIQEKGPSKERRALIMDIKKERLIPAIILLKEVKHEEVDVFERFFYELFILLGFDLKQASYQFNYFKQQSKRQSGS